jgi:hypothetical protein
LPLDNAFPGSAKAITAAGTIASGKTWSTA